MSFLKRIIIFSIIALAVIVLLVVFGVVPLFSKNRGVIDEIIAEKKSIFLFDNEFAIAEQFETGYENMEFNPKNIDGFLIPADAPVDFIKFLENMARENNLLIEISPYSVVKLESDPKKPMGFALSLTGEFLDFLRFFEKIENSNYFIQVQKVQARRLAKNDLYLEKYGGFSPKDVKVNLNIKVFTKE